MHVTADRGRRSYMDRSLVRFTCMVAWEKKIFKNCCGETKNKIKIKIKITSVAEKKSWLYPTRGILKSNAGKSRSRKSKVRFASDVNEQAKGPLQGWTWGGRAVWSLDCEKLNLEINHRREERHEHAALRARLWGELVARHVAAGCNGPWSKSYKTDLDWSYRKSHRKWCPPGLPDPGLQVGRWCAMTED